MGYGQDFMMMLAGKNDKELDLAKSGLVDTMKKEQRKHADPNDFADPEMFKNYKWQLNMINTEIGRRKREQHSGADGSVDAGTPSSMSTSVPSPQSQLSPDAHDVISADNAKAPSFDDTLKTKTLDDLNSVLDDLKNGSKVVEGDVTEKMAKIKNEIANRTSIEADVKNQIANASAPVKTSTQKEMIMRDAAIGAGLGAVVGFITGHFVKGLVIGAAAGAGIGYVRSNAVPKTIAAAPSTPSASTSSTPSSQTPTPSTTSPNASMTSGS